MTKLLLSLVLALLCMSPRTAQAETARMIVASRVQMGAILPDVPEELASVDLGASPPAGSSRLYSVQDLTAAARQAGSRYVVKDAIRVVRATKRWTQSELVDLIAPAVKRSLPLHAHLLHIDVPKQLITAQGVELSRVQVGQIPNHRGAALTSAVLELRADGNIEQRVALTLHLDLDDPPKPVEVTQGTTITLVVNLGAAKVSTAAIALQTAAVGSIALFRVVKTRKTLHAKLISALTAEVVGS
ncbi:MAG TPA: flagella basal body P-ring formation protein FlgA [Polyangiaceae bacterium]